MSVHRHRKSSVTHTHHTRNEIKKKTIANSKLQTLVLISIFGIK